MRSYGRVSRVKLYLLNILVLTAHGLQATTYVVGTCKPRLRSFSNISAVTSGLPVIRQTKALDNAIGPLLIYL
jgi:hypothetical protein